MRSRLASLVLLLVVALAGCRSAQDEALPDITPTAPLEASAAAPPPPSPSPSPAAVPPPPPAPPAQRIDFTDCPPQLRPKQVPAGLTITLTTTKNVFAANEEVPLTMRLVNSGPAPVERRWARGQQDYDLWNNQDGGRTLWRWAYGDEFTGGAGSVVYAPGDSREVKEVWAREVCSNGRKLRYNVFPPGRYVLRGYFADNDGAWYSNEVKIEIR